MEVRSAAIYCRLSYAPDGSLEKVERQEADCRATAQRLNWPISERHIYHDNSRSAWQRNRKRPGWDSLLAAIEAGEVDGVVVYHGDRLIRQPFDLEVLLRLADDKHLPLASVSGTRDLHNEDDRYILRIEAAGFCRESASTSRRVKRGWAARARDGREAGGGKRPFGYGVPTNRVGRTGRPIYDVTRQNPEEAAVLQEAVRRLLAGEPQGSVLAWMNTVSTTSQGQRWSGKALTNLLKSPRIAGFVAHQGELIKAVWDPIISEEDWRSIGFLMGQRAEAFGYHGRERRYLLTGIATCVSCGGTLVTKPSGGRNRKTSRLYHCPRTRDCSGRVSRNVDHLDRYVTGRVLHRLADPDLLAEVIRPDPEVVADLAKLEARRAQLKAAFTKLADHPDLDPLVLADQLTAVGKQIETKRQRHAAGERERLLTRMAGITLEQWEATPIEVRAATVRALFRIVVLPATWRGPGFDPASVDMQPI
ncbi:recombinase family protein [Herbidospora sp. NEAU-GS84]|uniref:Recombinase family protein n=1 Tax=Herbidospora solisilvae TaxID=2696284 RepID=A0A7C9N6Q5_9ACTN|nr:recombinase family protein [Herbidospora solisilvae]NAS22433.1 recombinase family protein [Herbidospora solisilvae]